MVLDRQGTPTHVIVGDAHQIHIPDLGRDRAGAGNLRGLRLVHTHLRSEALTQDDLTDLSLLRFDCVIAIEALADGLPGFVEVGRLEVLGSPDAAQKPWVTERRQSVYGWEDDFLAAIRDLETRLTGRNKAFKKVPGTEGCIVVGVTTGDPKEAKASLDELERLADTAGLQVMDRILQVKKQYDGRTLIGKGKLQEVLVRAMQLGADVLVFDRELSPSQLRNVASETELKVLDRPQLILDIFAQRATTREGKLQVEVAQLRYMKPRLAIMPTAMSRLTGGIGGRGPGETKLEINRRRADERVTALSKQLKTIAKHRNVTRGRRNRSGIPVVSIVGYTNAGKSTILNKMTRSGVVAEDKLFATLDPTSRRLRFPEQREVLLTDTVGFIRNLPKELVEAFRSTLEEVLEGDLILHVVDAASPEIDVHMETVDTLLDELGAQDTPRLVVMNKIDRVPSERWQELKERYDAVLTSAVSGEGMDALLLEMERRLFRARAKDAQAPRDVTSGTDDEPLAEEERKAEP